MAATSANTLATCSRVKDAPQHACRKVNMIRLFRGTPYVLVSESTCAASDTADKSVQRAGEKDEGRLKTQAGYCHAAT